MEQGASRASNHRRAGPIRRPVLGRWCAGCDGPLPGLFDEILVRGSLVAGAQTRGGDLGLCVECRVRLGRAARAGWVEPPPGLDALGALWYYRPPVSGIIVAGKNLGRRRVLSTLGNKLGAWSGPELARFGPLSTDAVVTWVPAHREARRRRGFDQGQLLACNVAYAVERNRRRLLLRRSAPTRAGASRRRRLRGPDLRAPSRPPSTVILVDDVCTTGSSLRAAAEALRQAGAQQVIGLVLARAEPG